MIPLRLTLQGLYSYQEKQTIDFTPLTGAGLFGIFGQVGSGKSTILEAITYALYGETDRLNARDSRGYNMMNLKSDELFMEFIFKAGKDGAEYLAIAKAKRNSRKFDDVKTIDRTAYKKENTGWTPVPVESLPGIIGLSYENFKRTIIIPQGRFQEFLQLGNKDRTQMMKELFNLEKYELFYKVAALETKNSTASQLILGKLQQLGEVDLNKLVEFSGKLSLLKSEIEILSQEIEKNQQQNKEMIRLKDLFTTLSIRQKSLAELINHLDEFNQLEHKIRDYENCLIHFKGLFDQFRVSQGKINQLEKLIRSDGALLVAVSEKIKGLESDLEKLKPDYEKREELKQQAEELKKIGRIIETDTKLSKLAERIKNGEEIYNQSVKRSEHLKEAWNQLQESIAGLKSQLPDMAELSVIKDWFTINRNFFANREIILKEEKFIQNEIDVINNQVKVLRTRACFHDIPGSVSPGEVMPFLNSKIEVLKKKITEIDEAINHLSVQSKLQAYADGLQDGEPCPLCGSLLHPHPLDPGDVADGLQKTKNNRESINSEVLATEEAARELSGLLTKLQIKLDQAAGNKEKQMEISSQLNEHKKDFSWPRFQEEETVKKAFELDSWLKKEITKKETAAKEHQNSLDKEAKNRENYRDAVEKLKQETASFRSESVTLNSQIRILKTADFENKPEGEISSLADEFNRNYEGLVKKYENIVSVLSEAEKEKLSLTARTETNRNHLKNELSEKEQVEKKISEQMQKFDYKSVEEAEAILSHPMDIVTEKKKITDYLQNLRSAETEVDRLKTDIGESDFNEEEHLQLQNTIVIQTGNLENKKKERWKVENDIGRLQEDLKSQEILKKEKEALDLRGEDIRTLKKLFTASGFVNYISSIYLQNLCRASNERFYKLTRQKLSLEITDDNNFEVRDFMNGGKVRSVKTLSGGQTFQAALSMALALADNIQKITGSGENFFFLDEGFGSLDKESLEIVFDTLKSLRKENRIGVVISHVEEIQQGVGMHLKITNYEDRGSIVDYRWKT